MKIPAILFIFSPLLTAQQFTSRPSGREVLTIPDGFSYHGLRLHRKPIIIDSPVVTVTSGSATVSVEDGVADALAGGSSTYLFEIESGDALGAVLTIISFNATSDTITLSDDVSADFSDGDLFTIRPAATLASIFGANNSAGLAAGFGGSGGTDEIWLPNGSGGFNKYYYDDFSPYTFTPSWVSITTGSNIDPDTVPIIYTDGFVTLGGGGTNTFKVSGTPKLSPTTLVMNQTGVNYLSSIYPTGSSLVSMFGAENSAGLDEGFAAPGGTDDIWIPDGTGGFDKIYYDAFNSVTYQPEWSDVATGDPVANPSSISFDAVSGFIISNYGGPHSITIQPPAFYESL